MTHDVVTVIRTQLKTDLKAAMKARQQHSVAALRSLLAAIDNAEAVDVRHLPAPSLNIDTCGHAPDVPRKVLTKADVGQIILKEAHELQQAQAEYTRLGLHDDAQRLAEELASIQHYVNEYH